MAQRQDNYQIQVMQAKKLFLSYNQEELIQRCCLRFDEDYLYTRLLSDDFRICRKTGDMERLCRGKWVDGNSFYEVMTLLDWLCDSRADRFITGRWVNLITQGYSFHRSLQDEFHVSDALLFDKHPRAFAKACEALGGEKLPGGDLGFAIELLDGLRIFVQFWHGDEEFSPRLRCLWDENALRYLRYETTWYAAALLMERIREQVIAEIPHGQD